MKISGTAELNAPIDQVWAAFTDPAVLARTIPGCHELREVGPDKYEMTVTAGVASIKGTYQGDVRLTEQIAPDSFVLKAAGAGAPGTLSADVKVTLLGSASGGTDLSYDADAVIGGAIGGVGQRMLTGVAKKMAGQFFAAVDADIAGVRVSVAANGAAASEGTAAGGTAAADGAASGGAAASDGAAAGALVVAASGSPEGQRTFAGSAAGGRAAYPGNGFQGRDFLVGAVVGALIALTGVAVGGAAGRR